MPASTEGSPFDRQWEWSYVQCMPASGVRFCGSDPSGLRITPASAPTVWEGSIDPGTGCKTVPSGASLQDQSARRIHRAPRKEPARFFTCAFTFSQHHPPIPSSNDRRRKDLSSTKLRGLPSVSIVLVFRRRPNTSQSQTHIVSADGAFENFSSSVPSTRIHFPTKLYRCHMTVYLTLAFLWTMYIGLETYIFGRPQSRPHIVGFLIINTLLAPISFVLSATGGVLRERVETAYRAAWASKRRFARTDRKKLLG